MSTAHYETDPRTLAVLSTALHSPGKATRLRAVAMLARVDCPSRLGWLEDALRDGDEGVRATALAVIAWVLPAVAPTWPQREACDRVSPDAETRVQSRLENLARERYQWEYTVEVWRTDGLLLGVYAVTTCEEDDGHARSIALGQAILANVGRRGDRFDPATAATFIVSKRNCARGPTRG